MFCDCHAHIDGYEPRALDEMIKRAIDNGVERIVGVGMTAHSSAKTVAIIEKYSCVVAAAGLHPWNAMAFSEEEYQQLELLAGANKVSAMGEIGLDYVKYPETKEIQKRSFEAQVQLANKFGLPIIVHCRGAHNDTLATITGERGVSGIIHGFTGDEAMLRDWLDIGFYISLGMAVVSQKDENLNKIMLNIPADRLLIETDSSPGRFLSEGLEPALVKLVAQKLAETRSVSLEKIASITTENLKKVLNLSFVTA